MLGVIVAAIMAASFFMPWVSLFGDSMGPTMLFEDGGPDIGDMPWQVWAFLASFVLAALGAVLGLAGRAAGLVMLIAGAIPFALIGQQLLKARGQAQDIGAQLPIPQTDGAGELWNAMREVMGIGLPAYFISAALLVVIGLVRTVRGR